MRGRLINPFLAEIAQLDTVATSADPDGPGSGLSGYDSDFKETVVLESPGGGRTDARREKPPLRVPCQVEVGAFEALQPLALKGISRPVPGFLALGLKREPEPARGVAGLRAPMIGRGAELDQIRSFVEALTGSRQGRLVLISGEAGLGKSRLLAELRGQLEGGPAQYVEGHSLTYRRSAAYWIFTEALRSLLGVTPYMPAAQVALQLADRAARAAGTQAGEVLPYLEHLLGLPASDRQAASRLQAPMYCS